MKSVAIFLTNLVWLTFRSRHMLFTLTSALYRRNAANSLYVYKVSSCPYSTEGCAWVHRLWCKTLFMNCGRITTCCRMGVDVLTQGGTETQSSNQKRRQTAVQNGNVIDIEAFLHLSSSIRFAKPSSLSSSLLRTFAGYLQWFTERLAGCM